MSRVGLIILDGVGYRKEKNGNAVYLAKMPNYKKIIKKNSTLISASGKAVGLPSDSIVGNSEIGHITIGAGRKISQGLKLIEEGLKSGNIFKSEGWAKLIQNAKKSAMHFVGLLSDSFVHGTIKHLEKLILECQKEKVKKVYVHALIDGRDTPPQSATKYIARIQKFLEKTNKNYKLVDFGGRNKIVMDRYEANTDAVVAGFELYVEKKGKKTNDPIKTLKEIYKQNPTITDQEIEGYIIDNKVKIENGDSVLLYNFRGDRAIEFSNMFDYGKYLTQAQFEKINRCVYFGMMQYDGDLKIPKNFLVENPKINETLTSHLVKFGIHQFSVAETQKFGHITYYFNGAKGGKVSDKFETYKEIESDKNITFDQRPQMKAVEVADEFCKALKNPKYGFLKVNFANGDMVGHTGNLKSAIIALETLDKCLGKILKTAKENDVVLLITADHGNCEKMISESGEKETSHTTSPVFFSVVNSKKTKFKVKKDGASLSNIASAICYILGVPKNKKFDESLVE